MFNLLRCLIAALLISCFGTCFAQEVSIQAIPTPGMTQAPGASPSAGPFVTPGVESSGPQQAPSQAAPG